MLSCSTFNSAFVANVAIFLFKSALCMNLAVADLSTICFFKFLHQGFD